jgi:hypothetical protein
METDKQLYRVFGAQPQGVFQLAGLAPVGKCAMRSLAVKTLERRTDGVIVPEALAPPLSVIEFQFGENPHSTCERSRGSSFRRPAARSPNQAVDEPRACDHSPGRNSAAGRT